MSRFTNLFAANTIAATGLISAAIALSPSASADPAFPPVDPAMPVMPALNMLQQFASNPAGAAALLQTAATAVGSGASQLTGAPATLPVSPIVGAPDTAPLPGAPAPAAMPAQSSGTSLLPLQLLNQLGLPGDVANLTPHNMPFPIAIGDQPGIAPAPINPGGAVPPATNPAIAPTTPGGAGIGQLLPLAALP